MPRYRVVEKRAYTSTYLIDAADEKAAKGYDGDIIDTSDTDSYGDEILEVEEVADDEDMA